VQDCIFNALGRDYYFSIIINKDNVITGHVLPHISYPYGIIYGHLEFYRDVKKGNKWFFYYKEKLVLVSFFGNHWSQQGVINYFKEKYFEYFNFFECITFSIPAEIMPEVGMLPEITDVQGIYDPFTGKLKIDEFRRCKKEALYQYTIMKGDTWESIAKKFSTTEENIRKIYGKYDKSETPKEGINIIVNYKIVDGKLEVDSVGNSNTNTSKD